MKALLLKLILLWLKTLRIEWVGESSLPEKAILILWHDHLPICIRVFSKQNIHVLISLSKDGEAAAELCQSLGYIVHRGSSSKGAVAGVRSLLRGLENSSVQNTSNQIATSPIHPQNHSDPKTLIGMALDGPRGPRHSIKGGTLWLSQKTHWPLVPISLSANPSSRLSTWDQTLIPWPFAKITVKIGAPFFPKSNQEIFAAMQALTIPNGN